MDNSIEQVDIDEQIENDLKIEEANLIGEQRKQKDLLYKWGSRLSKLEDLHKRTSLELDVLIKEKYIFYSTQFERVLSANEVKIYVNGDANIIKLKNKNNKIETMMDTIRHGINALKTKGRTIILLIEQHQLNQL